VEGSTKTLQLNAEAVDGSTGTTGLSAHCTQTGYQVHPIGATIYVLTILTFWGWSAAMTFMTIQYYRWNEQHQVANRTLHFEDEQQLLKTFIILWGVGFAWCFALKWPYSIRSLFLRRCHLQDATHVAVFLQKQSSSASQEY
jgi:hypothetical protein